MRMTTWLPLAVALLCPAGATLGQTVSCSSDAGEKHYCEADTRYGARILQQTGSGPCVEGRTWGWDEQGIWVDKGCGGRFALGGNQSSEELPPGALKIACSSEHGARKYCPVETHGHVQLMKQRGDASCIHGTNWGFDTHGIWVDKGCGADFVVGAPDHPAVRASEAKPKSQRVSCTSDDGQKNYCDVETRGTKVQLARQLGPSPCQEGVTWGVDRQGLWVDRGCRGEFVIEKSDGTMMESCADSIGKKKAKELVERCQQVSPGTHPPCHDQNSCALIEEEIRRSCKLLGVGAPSFCAMYE